MYGIFFVFLSVVIKGEKNIKFHGTDTLLISNPAKLPDVTIIAEMFEPTVKGTIITPCNFFFFFQRI